MLSLLFYVAIRPQEDPIAQHEKFLRSANSFKVDMTMKVSTSKDEGKGFFQIKRPAHLLFQMKWGASDFSFSCAENENVAIEREIKRYREYGAVGRLFVPETDISLTPQYGFPLALLAGSLRALTPERARFTNVGTGQFDGAKVNVVQSKFATMTANVTLTAKIDTKGKLVEYSIAEGDGPQAVVTTLSFRNYVINPTLKETSFLTPIPKGFVPQTLPADNYPINFGETMPLDGWKPVSGSADLKGLANNKVLFVVIGDPNCEVSLRAAKTVAGLAKDVEAKGGVSVAICPASSAPQPIYTTVPNFYDPTGKLYARLRTPGTPMFFIVSPKGLITRVWLGFDPEKAGEFVKDALEWVDPNRGLP